MKKRSGTGRLEGFQKVVSFVGPKNRNSIVLCKRLKISLMPSILIENDEFLLHCMTSQSIPSSLNVN